MDKIQERFKGNKTAYNFAIFQFVMIVLISLSIFKMPLNPDFNVIKSSKFIQKVTTKQDFVFYVMDEKYQYWDPTYLFHCQRLGFNLSLANLEKENYVNEIANKYETNYNREFIYIPNKFKNDIQIEKLHLHLKPFKKDSIGILYKFLN